jgi:hypothetical protein
MKTHVMDARGYEPHVFVAALEVVQAIKVGAQSIVDIDCADFRLDVIDNNDLFRGRSEYEPLEYRKTVQFLPGFMS